jgi:serine O-acetyltransferase
MILSKSEYYIYLKEDSLALGHKSKSRNEKIMYFLFPDYIWRFQKLLRKTEYYKNCKKSVFGKLKYLFLQIRFRRYSLKLGFSIPLNVFGPGLAIVHYGTIIVNANAKVGKNCRIHATTNIGASGGTSKAPQIGDNVYIGPGVKIYGDIFLANNIAIAANAAVGKSFFEENIMIGGVPAEKIKSIDITSIIKHIKKPEL